MVSGIRLSREIGKSLACHWAGGASPAVATSGRPVRVGTVPETAGDHLEGGRLRCRAPGHA